MNILANDGIPSDFLVKLVSEGHFVSDENQRASDLADYINRENIDVLVVRSATKVTKELIDSCPSLKYVYRAGVGLDNVDVHAAGEAGVRVFNTPNSSTRSVAEMVMSYIYSFSRRIDYASKNMIDLPFNTIKKDMGSFGREVSGKNLGIIGFGNIGRSVAILAQANGMNCVYYDVADDSTSLERVFQQSDFITIHISGKSQVLGRNEFMKMKRCPVIINTSRGGCVNEPDLLEAISNGVVAGACLDVFENEPNPGMGILTHPNIICTPHIGGSTKEAQSRVWEEIVDLIGNHSS